MQVVLAVAIILFVSVNVNANVNNVNNVIEEVRLNCGAVVDGCRIEEVQFAVRRHFGCLGRGLVATRQLNAGETIINVPVNRCTLNRRVAIDMLGSSSGGNVSSSIASSVLMSIALCHRSDDVLLSLDRRISRSWRLALEKLVQRGVEEAEMSDQFDEKRAIVDAQFELIERNGFSCDFECFRSAMDVMWSRAIEASLGVVVVPVVDFINHADTPNAVVEFDALLNEFSVRIVANVPRGEQISINYGSNNYNDDRLLRQYGFATTNTDIV
jgi:SET domain